MALKKIGNLVIDPERILFIYFYPAVAIIRFDSNKEAFLRIEDKEEINKLKAFIENYISKEQARSNKDGVGY